MHVDVVIIILLENEAHVDIQEEHGWTSLMVLSQNGHVNVVKLLLENKAWVAVMHTLLLHNGHVDVTDTSRQLLF